MDNLGTPASPGVVLTSSYDNLSRRTQLTASVNSVADFRNNYTYDSLSRIAKITQQSQAGGNSVAAKRVEFAYNAVGQYTSVTRYADLTDNAKLVATSTYGYDAVGRINSLSHAKSTTTFNAYTGAYDALGRPTQQTSNDGTDTFTYDASSQVTAATHTSQANESNSYDATGNRTNAGYSTGTNNQLLSDGTYSYLYDAEGNRTRKTEIVTGNYEVLAWDHHNRLTGIKFYTSAGTLTKEVAYTYDVFDRRIGKTVDNNADGVFDTTQRFIYDGEDIVLVYDGAGARTNRYLVGPNVDEILADENGAGTVTWSLSDNLGTVRDLVQYNGTTNVSTVVNHIGYTTFGQISSQTNSAFQPLFAYTGREWDGDANLYFYRARWYDPRTARFTSEDPIGFAAGDVNLNRYVFNTPTMWVDPSGMQSSAGGMVVDQSAYQDMMTAMSSFAAGCGGGPSWWQPGGSWAADAMYDTLGMAGSVVAFPYIHAYDLVFTPGYALGFGDGLHSGATRIWDGFVDLPTTYYDYARSVVGIYAWAFGDPSYLASVEYESQTMKWLDSYFSNGGSYWGAAGNLSKGTVGGPLTFGVYPALMAAWEWAETGDPSQFQYWAGGNLFGTILSVGIMKAQGPLGGNGTPTATGGPNYRGRPMFAADWEADFSQRYGGQNVSKASPPRIAEGPPGPTPTNGVPTSPPHPTFQPGPFAGESIPARSSSRVFTPGERAEINRIGRKTGCHTCGTRNPGTKSGNFIPDHQTPSALNNNAPHRLYPHCICCSRQQGLAIARHLRGL